MISRLCIPLNLGTHEWTFRTLPLTQLVCACRLRPLLSQLTWPGRCQDTTSVYRGESFFVQIFSFVLCCFVTAVKIFIFLQIINPETGEILGPEENGELLSKCSCPRLGYHNAPDDTAAMIDDNGWVRSGMISFKPWSIYTYSFVLPLTFGVSFHYYIVIPVNYVRVYSVSHILFPFAAGLSLCC